MQIGLKNLEKVLRTLVEASVDTGVATGGGTNYLDDAAKSWPDNAFANLIIEITGGTGAGQIRKITSNTATRITVTPDWTTVPDATSTYRIGFYGKMSGDITSWGGVAVTGRDITQDIARLDITLSALRDAITAAAPNSKTLNDLYARLGEVLGRNVIQWGGATLTGRDISLDLAKLDIALSTLRDAITAAAPNNKTLYDLYTQLSRFIFQENDYDYVELDLGTARTDVALGLSGTSLTVKDLTGTATVSVRFNSTTKPLVPLVKGELYQLKFTEVYLTNTAQSGSILKLFVGKVI